MSSLSDRNTAISNALGSAFAGIVSRIFTHPIDTGKSRLQAQYATTPSASSSSTKIQTIPHYRGTFDVLSKTFQAEGVRGLYRGFGAILIGGTPGTATYLCTYEMAKHHLGSLKQHDDTRGDFLVHFSAGMIAETVACIIYVPVDVIKARKTVCPLLWKAQSHSFFFVSYACKIYFAVGLQVQHAAPLGHSNSGGSSAAYEGSFDALKKIAKTEGLSGIYKGYAATLASFGPFSALYFMFYEKFKAETRQYLFDPHQQQPKSSIENMEIPFPWLVLCTASAGALASWLTSPLDMAKLRLQVQRGEAYQKGAGTTTSSSSMVAYRGVVDCLQTVYRQGGIRGLFRGAGARVCFYAPATSITMCCYETCRSFVAKLLAKD